MDLNSYLYIISKSGISWIDILIIIIIIFYAIGGYAASFWDAFCDLITFVVAFFSALLFYGTLAKLILIVFKIPQGFANAIGFFLIAFIFEIVLSMIFKSLICARPKKEIEEKNNNEQLYKIAGIIPSVLSGLILVTFILTVIVALPLSLFLKQAISTSSIGNILVANTQGLSKDINQIFEKSINDSLSFLTIEPESEETISLNFKTDKIKTDPTAENKMLDLINFERKKQNLSELEFAYDLQQVARYHCEDMLKKGYFSHKSSDGYSPFDRMAQFDVYYTFAGENLAFAPNVALAMKGLMQSQGHKENILSNDFKRVGIGVIDAGIYGQIYCQEFTD